MAGLAQHPAGAQRPARAIRVAAVYIALGFIHDLLLMSGGALAWFSIVSRNLALQLFSGMVVWVFYTALEPYVRRLWPDTLISWTRLLDGRLRDPLVGRHVLIEGLAGVVFISFAFMVPYIAAEWTGIATARPPSDALEALSGTRASIAAFFFAVQDSFFVPIAMLLVVLVLRVLLRRPGSPMWWRWRSLGRSVSRRSHPRRSTWPLSARSSASSLSSFSRASVCSPFSWASRFLTGRRSR